MSKDEQISVALMATAGMIIFWAIVGVIFYYAMKQFRKKKFGRKYSLRETASRCSKSQSTGYSLSDKHS